MSHESVQSLILPSHSYYLYALQVGTVVLSFIAFSKPLSWDYIPPGILVLTGIFPHH